MSNKVRRGIWDDEGRKRFREGFGVIEEEANTIEKEWKNMEDRIKEVMMRIEEEERGREEKVEREGRGWWNEECKKLKKEVRGELREWRRKDTDGRVYRERKKEYKDLCDRKKKEENEKWKKKAKEARRENEVWEIINRERKRR